MEINTTAAQAVAMLATDRTEEIYLKDGTDQESQRK